MTAPSCVSSCAHLQRCSLARATSRCTIPALYGASVAHKPVRDVVLSSLGQSSGASYCSVLACLGGNLAYEMRMRITCGRWQVPKAADVFTGSGPEPWRLRRHSVAPCWRRADIQAQSKNSRPGRHPRVHVPGHVRHGPRCEALADPAAFSTLLSDVISLC